MYSVNDLNDQITQRESLIEQLHGQIRELHYQPVMDDEGDIVSYADLSDRMK